MVNEVQNARQTIPQNWFWWQMCHLSTSLDFSILKYATAHASVQLCSERGHSMLEGCGYEVLRSFGFGIKFVLWHFGQWFIIHTAYKFIRLMWFSSTCKQWTHWQSLLAICKCSDSVYLMDEVQQNSKRPRPYLVYLWYSSVFKSKDIKELASQKDLTTGPHLCRICMMIPQVFPLFTSLCVAKPGKWQLLLLCLKTEWFTSVI